MLDSMLQRGRETDRISPYLQFGYVFNIKTPASYSFGKLYGLQY